jgi:hypothetical protein
VAWLTDTILRLAGPLVLVVVFALPALEASILLGIVVPGELAWWPAACWPTRGGCRCGRAVVAGAAGAVVGDSLGYALGRRVGERLLARVPRRPVEPRQVGRATARLRRLGGRAVFVGRFTAALRALVPAPGRDRRDGLPQLRGLEPGRGRALGHRVRPAGVRRRPRPGAQPSASPGGPACSCWARSSPGPPRRRWCAGGVPVAMAPPAPDEPGEH